MKQALLDTDTVSYFFRGIPQVIDKADQYIVEPLMYQSMNKPFSVTAKVWKDVPLEKGVFIHSLSDLLNAELQLADYGNGVAEFNFTAIIEPEEFFPTKYSVSQK